MILVALPAGSLRVFIGFATILNVGASLMGGAFRLGRPVLRATLAACFFVGEVVSLALLAAAGRLHGEQAVAAAWLLPALGLGVVGTRWFYGRLNGRPLRLAMLAFALLSGVVCLV